MGNHFIVVDPFNSGALYVDILREIGENYVTVYSSRCQPFINQKEILKNNEGIPTYFEWEYHDFNQLVQHLEKLGTPRYITTGHDAGIKLADQLRTQLTPEKANATEFSEARWNKAVLCEALGASGVDHLDSFTIKREQNLDDILNPELFSNRSFVLKPLSSGGGDHVHHVKTADEACRYAESIFKQQNLYGEIIDEIVVQEYFEGNEYVVDTVSRGGIHRVSDILAYGKHKSRKQGFIYDYARWVEPHEEVVDTLKRYAFQVLDAIGVKYGVAHIEILEQNGRAMLVEVGTRPCGAGVPSLVYEVSDHSQMHQELLWELDGAVPPHVYPFKKYAALVFLSSLDEGIFVNNSFRAYLENNPMVSSSNLEVEVGDKISPTRFLGDSTALGRVFVTGDDNSKVQSTVEEILSIFKESIVVKKASSDEVA